MIGILQTGNSTSVQNAFTALRITSIISNDKEVLNECNALVVPGVGAFGELMKTLGDTKKFIKKWENPYLGICLGMQILFEKSKESKGVEGLGIIKGEVKQFENVRVPQIGWNLIENTRGELFDEEGNAYFVNSFYCVPKGTETTSTSNYGVVFASSVRKNNFYGVQFHPEKSGKFGLMILKRFARLCKC